MIVLNRILRISDIIPFYITLLSNKFFLVFYKKQIFEPNLSSPTFHFYIAIFRSLTKVLPNGSKLNGPDYFNMQTQ